MKKLQAVASCLPLSLLSGLLAAGLFSLIANRFGDQQTKWFLFFFVVVGLSYLQTLLFRYFEKGMSNAPGIILMFLCPLGNGLIISYTSGEALETSLPPLAAGLVLAACLFFFTLITAYLLSKKGKREKEKTWETE